MTYAPCANEPVMPPAPRSFENPDDDFIRELLFRSKIIAVPGLSPSPYRPSHRVAFALQAYGYRIIPVRPGVVEILGEVAVSSLDLIDAALDEGERVDIVDVFRAPQHADEIVTQCLRLRPRALWLQEGIVNPNAAVRARDAGIPTIMDRCILKERARLVAT